MTGPAHPGRRVTDRQTRITGLNDLIDMTLVENVGGSGRLTQMASGRDVATSGGWVDYSAIVNGQRGAVQARITRSMIRQGSAATYNFPFIRRRMGYMVVRGHLLARVLGGSGADGRNLVPLPHSANNLPMYADIESRIQRSVERGGEVLFTAFPVYLGGAFPDPRSVLPTAIRVTATDATTGANVVSELFDCSW
jgi:DNA/RNA non-specific endonuclease